MEDQFGGRTDDDLFYDDFEPVDSAPVVAQETVTQQPPSAPPAQETPAEPPAPPPPTTEPTAARPSKPKSQGLSSSIYSDNPRPSPEPQQPSPAPEPAPQPQTQPQPEPEPASEPQPQPQPEPEPPTQKTQPQPNQKRQKPAPKDGPPASAPTAPRDKSNRSSEHTAQTAVNHVARLQSGANPRHKLTDAELTAKMEQMKLVSAEKTRKFEKAEQDEKQHAQAYARGMEEARKRKVEVEEKRRRGEENQRKLNDERAKNRERKLKAMGMKEGGWDEGKEALAEEEARKSFKGANGGVRGTRSSGLSGSRYAKEGEDTPDVNRFLEDRGGRGGRRRGGGGRGRGGGSRGGRGGHEATSDRPAEAKPVVPTPDDFPALPSDGVKKQPSTAPEKPALTELPKLTGGKWDDEMADLDEAKKE